MNRTSRLGAGEMDVSFLIRHAIVGNIFRNHFDLSVFLNQLPVRNTEMPPLKKGGSQGKNRRSQHACGNWTRVSTEISVEISVPP